jgi:chromate reductase, NAD(P)H dehydrogenase (quinone)
MPKIKIAVLVGSNRRESITRKLAQAIAKLAGQQLAFHFAALDDLPLYNQDPKGEMPKSVVQFKAEIAAADALLFVTPEHNRSIPALLKNAIDWGRPAVWSKLVERKPAAGALGAAMAQTHLRQVLGILGVLVMGGEAYISFKPGLVDANGAVTDENTRQFLQGFIEQFAALLARLSFARAAAA